VVDFPYLFLLPPSSLPRTHSTPILYVRNPASLSTISMASIYFRVSPTAASNLSSSDINELVSSLLQVANLTVNFLGESWKDTTTFTPTLSSPQPQAGAMARSLTAAFSSTFVAAPQGTTCNLNILPTNSPAPTIENLGSFYPSPLLFRYRAHLAIGPPSISIPSPYFSGLFNSMTIFNFETLFNFLVIVCLLYLFFTPPVSGLPSSSSLFPHEFTTTTRSGTLTRINRSATSIFPLMIPNRTFRRSTPSTPPATLQSPWTSQAGLERPGPAIAQSSKCLQLPPENLWTILQSRNL